MQQAKHVGKVVIELDQSPVVVGDAQYMIFGGLGGLGLSLASWLINKKVKRIVLISRNVPSPQQNKQIDALRLSNTEIEVLQCNVNHAVEVKNLFNHVATSSYPLKGIFHCAGVLDDAMLSEQNDQRFIDVMAPKVNGAWFIHQHTQNLPLDFFVLFSSATSMLGSSGQASYIAANSFLDSLAYLRKAQGLPTISINWGAWDAIGMAADKALQAQLARLGIQTIPPSVAIELMDAILPMAPTQIGAFGINWEVYLRANSDRAYFHEVMREIEVFDEKNKGATESQFLKDFYQISSDERLAFIQQHIEKNIAAVLGITKPLKMDRQQGLFDMGMDSLTSVELKNRLSAAIKINLPATLAFDYPNINALSDYLLSLLVEIDEASSATENNSEDNDRKQIENLSEDEAEETLKRTLKEMGFENK
jgi:acyl carrier protein/NAD(P)-dependent dehydrogenase (short-subunit alcohol dehydrogenase family)